ncbi:MAG: glycosyltransferase family 4 protein [Proteiniphilum sp.]|mgnify:CR=1 FL=1|jgi:glycosyltransferase involved in cell wall biosynthesis|nr:glycosyltransferase family 4 protein [Proteiniphilum sp.]MDD2937277.1 glycosyltransferase family 4 protein [Proteiniphilum sp.]MDD3075615.1 glycosyltransferase family 4 protein [Proteiniphilum sp.]MDD3779125.1 glycosyltransferase family 4 protein [Proteiniphilum sp.]MDD3955660.1 glycosyltransferase family 4 protein [Proteiniphilum sp.]
MNKIAIIGNYPPRQCGIATFTKDLNEGFKEIGVTTAIVAMNDGLNQYDYPDDVVFEVEQNVMASYIYAAQYLNANSFDAVILQHEFGIFGGEDGKNIIQLLTRLRIPIITTFHTVIDNPTVNQHKVVTEIARLSQKLVCISQKGIELLNDIYGLPVEKCVHIHHGVHQYIPADISRLRKKLGVENKKVLLTFGLLSPNKSIEVVINALPEVVEKNADIVYVVLGATHPHVIKQDGEDYRLKLIRLVGKLGLEKNVIFINRFVSNEELFSFLALCDIYVIPYMGEKQISSGTLIYTMAAAKPIISTPFWYAKEMLSEERGLLFDFQDSQSLSKQINMLFENEERRKTIAQNAFNLAKTCYWSLISRQYDELAELLIEEDRLKSSGSNEQVIEPNFILPPIKLDHLRMLTDYTGILQHAKYNVPDRNHGYCTDDNTRALLLSIMLESEVQDVDEINRLTGVYLSFIDYAYNQKNGKFRNLMNYQREWIDEEGSEDTTGRVAWALGYTASYTQMTNFRHHANHLFDKVLPAVDNLTHPRAIAYATLGLVYYAKKNESSAVMEQIKRNTERLYALFEPHIDKEWLWFEEKVSYANSRIPQAMIQAGLFLHNKKLIDRGTKILDWLIAHQFHHGIFSPVGNMGWLTLERKAQFDQQPLEANGMIDACLQAEEYARNGTYADYALKAFYWFTGDNDCAHPLYDFATGGCRDGLHRDGVNLNQGGESTLSWLISLLSISFYLRNKNNELL